MKGDKETKKWGGLLDKCKICNIMLAQQEVGGGHILKGNKPFGSTSLPCSCSLLFYHRDRKVILLSFKCFIANTTFLIVRKNCNSITSNVAYKLLYLDGECLGQKKKNKQLICICQNLPMGTKPDLCYLQNFEKLKNSTIAILY